MASGVSAEAPNGGKCLVSAGGPRRGGAMCVVCKAMRKMHSNQNPMFLQVYGSTGVCLTFLQYGTCTPYLAGGVSAPAIPKRKIPVNQALPLAVHMMALPTRAQWFSFQADQILQHRGRRSGEKKPEKR